MKTIKILAVEDDDPIRKLLIRGLGQYGYQVTAVPNGSDALTVISRHVPDIIILDINLGAYPDGIEVCRRVRQSHKTPIIMLSASDDKTVKLEALNIGADDYIVKPFDLQEMEARIRTILRRSITHEIENNNAIIEVQGLVIDLVRRRVLLNDNEIRLTPKEYQLLQLLATHPGKVLTYQTLLTGVGKDNRTRSEHYVSVFINSIRKKLHQNIDEAPRFIVTVPGIGYQFVDI
jgi:two-component system, OmpR family, KDP operon response regulator KdpE